ncbi:amidohydrolase family protein [Streptomyces sp. NBC_00083]|uniref:metal-dependent hydrolase family protein n=1 Tax=Streptomyces sp. NBC_00083 TaxID=2975647 RepID=UPI00224ED923|nr:amidohydrolase family protein [Streptomyces sp. NBC_00083]MCX5386998.1 amidohydrolase family protein [Streptomyces sp. NBC_00083]
MSEPLLLTSARLWDGTAATSRAHTGVLVEGDRITAVDARAPGRGTRTLDLGNRTLLPGLIDAHVHLSSVPPTTISDAVSLQVLASLRPLRHLLDAGFTTVRDLGGALEEPLVIHLRDAIEAHLLSGPRIRSAPHIISSRSGHGDHSPQALPSNAHEVGAVADGVDEVRRRVRMDARHGADWIKFAATGGLSSPSDSPECPTYSQQEMDALVETASDLGLPCATHAFSDEGIDRALLAGVRSIEHACLASAACLARIGLSGTVLVPTLYVIENLLDHLDDESFWAAQQEDVRAKVERHAPTLRGHSRRVAAAAAAGVTLAFGTDAGMFPHADNWREFRSLTRAGLSPDAALRAATSTAADLLGRKDLGRIAPGCTADLIAVPEDPLRDIEALSAVDFVMREGAIHRSPGTAPIRPDDASSSQAPARTGSADGAAKNLRCGS